MEETKTAEEWLEFIKASTDYIHAVLMVVHSWNFAILRYPKHAQMSKEDFAKQMETVLYKLNHKDWHDEFGPGHVKEVTTALVDMLESLI